MNKIAIAVHGGAGEASDFLIANEKKMRERVTGCAAHRSSDS